MTYRVEISAEANRDLEDIKDWLQEQGAGENGRTWLLGLRGAAASLAEMPRRCGFAPENDFLLLELRQLLYGTKSHIYRILFTVTDDTVLVLHIRPGRRQPLT